MNRKSKLWILALATAGLPALAQQQTTPPSVLQSEAGELAVETLAELEFPWGMALLPDGRLLLTEKPGRLRLWQDGELSEPLEGLPAISHVGDEDQGGLLDVALAPDFQESGLVYFSYAEAAEVQPEGLMDTGDVRFGTGLDPSADSTLRGGAVARGRLEGNALHDVEVIWRQIPKTLGRGHFGHRLNFADDGSLYITSGDRMRFEPAQSLHSNLGKVVRINADGSIPEDNPFAAQDDALGEIWSLGQRNILAAAIHPDSGELWALEMGPLGGDELNRIEAGKNYGWPAVSNGSHYDGQSIPGHPADEEHQDPLRSWTPVISPSGALFYEGEQFPAWQGDLLVGGLSSQALVRLRLNGEQATVEERLDMGRRIRDLAQAEDGSLFLLVDAAQGSLLRLTPMD